MIKRIRQENPYFITTIDDYAFSAVATVGPDFLDLR